MSGVQSLRLEDAFDDSPQTRSLLGVFEKDARLLRGFSTTLHNCCTRILNAQREMCSATQSLSAHMKTYRNQNFPLDSGDSVVGETLNQFTAYIDELSSLHQILATQFADSLMFPLTKFIQADLDEVATMGEMHKLSTNDHEQSIQRYMKLPKKKLSDQARQEANEDLFVYRKKCHKTTLHYYAALNALQYKRRTALLEPMLGYMQAQRSFFNMGHDALCARPDIDSFLSNISASVQAVHRELATETQKTVDTVDTIEKSSATRYHPEPPAGIPPNVDLSQIASYLNVRSKQMLTTRWERAYFFIQGGNLMMQGKDEVAGRLVLDLNEDKVHAEPADTDDRRFLFQVTSPSTKKTVILQAENEKERLEWISTINNVVKHGGYVKGPRPPLQNQRHSAPAASMAIPARSREPATPTSTPVDGGFIPDAPIQFDIAPMQHVQQADATSKEGPQKRINPFDQSTEAMIGADKTGAAFSETFVVRFCGSMEVRHDRGEQLILETIRQIMAARAIHNVFKMSESHLCVSSDQMRLIDPSNNHVRVEYHLQDISYWAYHKENKRLFGFIVRTSGEEGRSKFSCQVFECNASGEEICHAISTATKLAFQALMEQKTNAPPPSQKHVSFSEKDILLANIGELDDVLDEEEEKGAAGAGVDVGGGAHISVDGQYFILADADDDVDAAAAVAAAAVTEDVEEVAGEEAEESEA